MSDLIRLAEQLGARLQQRGWMLSAAESCTGGWVAKVVTDVAGSSGWFDRGFVTYSNDAKTEMLGVPVRVFKEHGAVSEACVRAMALGSLARSRSQLAVAISGIAGPGGGSAEKPVGTVWMAWAIAGRCEALKCHFPGEREQVRRAAVEQALRGLLACCDW
ncbi:MAG: nicotinamide-nucleotide amidohydrolase family protein [Gammaproteobacteria bacterium]|nr:nicotinamide-nucleotide amidohydrolase family protein [Gammaproteobacteria bacterium]